MKNLLIVGGFYIIVALALPSLVKAQTQGLTSETAEGLDPARTDRPGLQVPQGSTQYAISSLLRTEGTHAGAPTKEEDTKSLTTPSVSAPEEDGFSAPTAYLEYKYAQIQDTRSVGLDGPQHNAIVGFDFESYFKTIVGFNFTYTNEALSDNGGPGFAQLENSSESYFFSPYVAKNFFDWLNVGGSFTYGRTDTTFRALSAAPFAAGAPLSGLDTTQDTYAYSPFIGISHTFGAWSFSSTADYIYGYDHFSFSPASPSFGAPAAPDAKTLNQTFLWLNNVQYAVTDKLSLSFQANMTHMLSTQSVPIAPGFTPNTFAHTWMSFGGRADYSFNKDGSVFASFEHDAFNVNFDDYRIRTGISYNF